MIIIIVREGGQLFGAQAMDAGNYLLLLIENLLIENGATKGSTPWPKANPV